MVNRQDSGSVETEGALKMLKITGNSPGGALGY